MVAGCTPTLWHGVDLLSEVTWLRMVPGLSIRSGKLPAAAAVPGRDFLARASAELIGDGYFSGNNDVLSARAAPLAAAVRQMVAYGLPLPFLFLFDEAWECFQLLRPVLTHLLGDGYAALPAFWVWHIGPGESGWSPHRDLGSKSLASDGTPLVLNVWIPLSKATERNGCIHIVPSHLDQTYGTGREADLMSTGHGRALPVGPGEYLCWNEAVIHWGGNCGPEESPRISMALEFQRTDVPPFKVPLIWPLSDLAFDRRIELVAMQLLQYDHWSPLAPEWRRFAEAFIS